MVLEALSMNNELNRETIDEQETSYFHCWENQVTQDNGYDRRNRQKR
jgi:hypothetical protein